MVLQHGGESRVAVAGLGLMGSALADALIAGGCEVTVWNRSPARAERFAGAGIRVATSVAEAAGACDVLVARDIEATLDVLAGTLGMTLRQCASSGIAPEHLLSIKAIMDRAIAMGHGQHDLGAIIEAIESGRS